MLPRARGTLFLASLLALCLLPASARAQDDGYSIRPGDKVTIEVYTSAGERVSVVSGERILDRAGDVFLPYVGTVHATGLDQTSLREHLATLFQSFYEQPVVNVKVELKINVTGAVRTPGQYFVDPTATVIDALSAAGGAGQELEGSGGGYNVAADQSQVRLVRDGQSSVFSVRAGEVTPEILALRIRSGDWLNVPARTRSEVRSNVLFWGSILGLVTQVITLVLVVR